MRRLYFDQFEFDTFSSEESLEIHYAEKVVTGVVQIRDLAEFIAATSGPGSIKDLRPAAEFTDRGGCSPVREYLWRFAGIEVPDPCNWRVYVLFEDDLEWDAVFETPDSFVRYHWMSTA